MKKAFLILLVLNLFYLNAGCQSAADQKVVSAGVGQDIGTRGPIILKLNQPGYIDQMTTAITINPYVELNLIYKEDSLEIRPKTSFQHDQEYMLTLTVRDIRKESMQENANFSWSFKTNPACLLYIAPVTQFPEIWSYCLDDQIKSQLSHTDGRVLGFNPSPDGKWIVYSSKNELGGADIWLMDRQGKFTRRLMDCGRDSCADVKFAGDEKTIAFIKLAPMTSADNNQRTNELHIMDIEEQKTSILRVNEKIYPLLMDMTNGNKRVTFFDQRSSSIWIHDLNKKTTIKLPSGEGLGGSWNKANDFFTFARMNYWGGIPYGEIYQYDPSSGTIASFLDGREDSYEFFSPQWRPQDGWLAIAIRPIDGSASKQIILISKDKEQRVNVTLDQMYSYGSFSWSSDGEMIAYQRLRLGDSSALPQVGLWRMQDRSRFILEENAASPQWIP